MADKPEKKTVTLTDKHTHEGKSLAPGAVLVLDADLADWLIGEKKAKLGGDPVKATRSPAPADDQ